MQISKMQGTIYNLKSQFGQIRPQKLFAQSWMDRKIGFEVVGLENYYPNLEVRNGIDPSSDPASDELVLTLDLLTAQLVLDFVHSSSVMNSQSQRGLGLSDNGPPSFIPLLNLAF